MQSSSKKFVAAAWIVALLVILAVLVVKPAHAADMKLDLDCNKMALNAKSFAQLKVTGVATTPEQFASFIVSPTVQSYPIRSILNYVFTQSSDKTPDQIYAALYGRCTQMGYKDLLEYFQEREQFIDMKAQVDALTTKLNASEADRGKLMVQIQQMKDEQTSPKRRNASMVIHATATKQ